MKKSALILIILSLWSVSAFSLTIDEAVKFTIENNNRIRQFQSQTGAQEMTVRSTRSAFKPTLDVGYSFNRQEEDVFFATPNTSAFVVEANYNLFRGFIDKYTLEKEKHLLNASRFEESATLADLVLATKLAFIEILKVTRNLEAANEGVELLERQKKDSENRFREGLIAKNDLLKVEVELASSRFAKLRVESNLRTARDTLVRTMGVGLNPDEPIEEPTQPEKLGLDMNTLKEVMLSRRSEANFLRSIIASEKSDRASIRGEYYPSLDLTANFIKWGDSAIPDGREGLFITDTELSGTITLKWNLYSGDSTRYDLKTKERDIVAREEELKDLERELTLQLERSIEENRITSAQIEVARDAITQAEENYRITDNQFKANITTTTNLLDARLFLTRARVEYNIAFYNLMISIAALERVLETSSIEDLLN